MSQSKFKSNSASAACVQGASAAAREGREARNKEVVLKKLRKATDLGFPASEHEQLAMFLCSEERMEERYFGDLLKSVREAVDEVRKEKQYHKGGIRNEKEQQTCMAGINKEADRVKAIEVELALSTLTKVKGRHLAQLIHRHVRSFHYGPFHAAIIVGDMVLEWNNSSLVIPRKRSESNWVFCQSILSRDTKSVLCDPVPVRASGQETDQHFECVIEKIEGVCMEKELLIKTLVDLAVRYNTRHHYDVVSNNCQKFVRDCLEVLGVPNEKFPFIEGKMKELADLLVRDGPKRTMCSDFATHKELSSHVESNIEKMTVEEMKYCLCLYHVFHTYKGDRPCTDAKCQEKQLETALEGNKAQS